MCFYSIPPHAKGPHTPDELGTVQFLLQGPEFPLQVTLPFLDHRSDTTLPVQVTLLVASAHFNRTPAAHEAHKALVRPLIQVGQCLEQRTSHPA